VFATDNIALLSPRDAGAALQSALSKTAPAADTDLATAEGVGEVTNTTEVAADVLPQAQHETLPISLVLHGPHLAGCTELVQYAPML